MALTHAQRTSMHNTLAEVMGQDDAETLMQHLPPSGWDNVATKEDLRAGFAELSAEFTSAMTAGFAQAAVERANIKAQAAIERADIVKAMTEGLTKAAVERADIKTQFTTELTDIKTQFTTELTDIKTQFTRSQAWHLYIVVSTIVLASVSMWIALLTLPGA